MHPTATNRVRLVVEALALQNDKAPSFAVVTVTPDFINRLSGYKSLFGKNAPIQALTIDDSPDRWGADDDQSIQGDTLRFWRDGDFWYEAQLNERDVVETRAIDLDTLTQIVATGPDAPAISDHFCWSNGSLYFAGDPERLEDLIVADASDLEASQHF